MVNDIKQVSNPLTLISIFAGLTEISGTVVLPFINEVNQVIFIYFVMFFPVLLVILFFLTLNYNNRVLYSPSDFKNDKSFIDLTRIKNSKIKNEHKFEESEGIKFE